MERVDGLGHLAIAAVHAGHVAKRAVAGRQEDTPGQRRFDRGQHIVAVQPERALAQRIARNLAAASPRHVIVAARTPRHGNPLPRNQIVAIADELHGRIVRIAAAQQPTQIGRRLAQHGPDFRGEQPKVVRVRAPVPSPVGAQITSRTCR